jgi:SAM-dependent methyltransferase
VLDLRKLRLRWESCGLCSFPLLVRLGEGEHAVRCLRCRANPAAMSLGAVLEATCPQWRSAAVYELSSRGPLFRHLQRHCPKLVYSEYFEGVPPGTLVNSVRCEDVQALSFDNASFDVVTSSDVFEHVADDASGFAEVRRVLRPGGFFVFSVPLSAAAATVERAHLVDGTVQHLLPPEYHADHLRGVDKVLCFRNYGQDITHRLLAAGFARAWVHAPGPARWWGCGRPIVVAQAAASER